MKFLSTLILFILSAFASFGQNKEKINEMNYFMNTVIDFFKADRYLLQQQRAYIQVQFSNWAFVLG